MGKLANDPSKLQRCFACDERFDPSYLDQTMYHLVAACCDWELVAFPWTAIRGTKVAEKAQG